MSPQELIAHYRILSKLGQGGMGAVYRATDTKLNRDVAIKILPPAFAADPDRLARFTREAQVLASLNHPNIADIYGIEQNAIVMELVEGDDLKGPVPVDTALAIARQIAAGLEAAHEKGIIHRDLKPANIKITPDGAVKLLDFGLAKATEQSAAASSASPTLSPTLSLAMTQAGMILGTAAYMAPEQARGKIVDRRADIWAFGVVLFELLTGRMLFAAGDTVTDIIAAVVTRDPDWNLLPPDTPPHVRRLLDRCLRKDPKLRLQAIGDARILLDDPDPVPSPAPAHRASTPRPNPCASACTFRRTPRTPRRAPRHRPYPRRTGASSPSLRATAKTDLLSGCGPWDRSPPSASKKPRGPTTPSGLPMESSLRSSPRTS
jgi:serine/threonine-protein kinase